MHWLGQILSLLVKSIFYQFAMKQAKKKAILAYLKTLQVLRRSMMLGLVLFVILHLMMFGMLGMIVTGVWLSPITDTETKLWVLFGISSGLFLLPMFGFALFFSEKLWFKVSGAEALLQEPESF